MPTRPSTLFALAASEDCEDIVAIYLQARFGYRLIPSTCRHDTPKTEFILARADGKAQTPGQAGQPARQGPNTLSTRTTPCQWFLFTTGGDYRGPSRDHVHCIDPQELREFAFDNLAVMPGRVRRLAEYCLDPPRLALSPPADRPGGALRRPPVGERSVAQHFQPNRIGRGRLRSGVSAPAGGRPGRLLSAGPCLRRSAARAARAAGNSPHSSNGQPLPAEASPQTDEASPVGDWLVPSRTPTLARRESGRPQGLPTKLGSTVKIPSVLEIRPSVLLSKVFDAAGISLGTGHRRRGDPCGRPS